MSARSRPLAASGHALRAPRTLTVGIIGAGRVGTVLGAALARAGHRISAVHAVSAASRARAERLLPGVRLLPVDQVPAGADLVLVSVPDDALSGLIGGLAEAGALRPGQVILHTSGSHGLAVLGPATAVGCQPLALHPAMTFTGQITDVDRLDGVCFGVTAPASVRPLATRLVADLAGTLEWVAEADRPLYHAAVAHGANHLATVVNDAMDLLRYAGVINPERVLRPLLAAALDNTLALGDAALTGPVVRGDAGTIATHLRVLRATAPDRVSAYLALARRTAERAIGAGRLRPHDAEPLLGVLGPARADARPDHPSTTRPSPGRAATRPSPGRAATRPSPGRAATRPSPGQATVDPSVAGPADVVA